MPELHEVMSPVWEVCPELKLEELEPPCDKNHPTWMLYPHEISVAAATALCRDAMVEGLAKLRRDPNRGVEIEFDAEMELWFVDVLDFKPFTAPTLVEALAAACIAVKGAQEDSDGE